MELKKIWVPEQYSFGGGRIPSYTAVYTYFPIFYLASRKGDVSRFMGHYLQT